MTPGSLTTPHPRRRLLWSGATRDRLEELKYIERNGRPFTVITGLPCATCRYGDELPEELRMTPFQHEAWHAYYAFHSLQPFAYGRDRFRTDKVIERFMKRVFVHWEWPIRTATRYPPGCQSVVKESFWDKPGKAWKEEAPAAWYHPTSVQNHALLEAAYRVLDSYLGDDGESEEPPPMPDWWNPEHRNQAGAFYNRVEKEARYELQHRFKHERHKRGTVRWSAFDSEDGIYSLVYDQDSRSSVLLRYLQDEPTRQLNEFGRRKQISAHLNRIVRYLPQEQQRAIKLFLAGASPEQAGEAILVREWRGRDALVDALTDALSGDAGAVEWTQEEILKPAKERYERNLKRAFNNPTFVQNMRDSYTPPGHIRLF